MLSWKWDPNTNSKFIYASYLPNTLSLKMALYIANDFVGEAKLVGADPSEGTKSPSWPLCGESMAD